MNSKGTTKEMTRSVQRTMLKRQIGNLEAQRALLEQKLTTFEESECGGSVPRPDWSTSFRTSHYTGPVSVMTVRDVSAYLRVHPSTIYRLLRHHQIPAFHVGSDWRFNIETIDGWRLAQGKLGG
jgi:excisionase family DNA binding protein